MAGSLRVIAEELGISQASVSQILNRKACDFSSQQTREKVFALARKLGYRQRFADKVLRNERTLTVAVLVSMHRVLIESHIQTLIFFLLNHFTASGYEFYLRVIAGTEEENLEVVQELLARGVDRFVCIGCPTGLAKIEALVQERGRFLVGYGEIFRRRVLCAVEQFISETIRIFKAAGRENFCYFLSSARQFDRIAVVQKAMPELPAEEVLQRHLRFLDFPDELPDLNQALMSGVDLLVQRGYECTRRLFEERPETDAVFYLSDYYLLGGVNYLSQRGIRIGSEVMLCGSNNIEAVRNHLVPLASWQLDMPLIAKILYDRSGDDKPFAEEIPRTFSPNAAAIREGIHQPITSNPELHPKNNHEEQAL